ncbi:CaiB/BaiF CoA transferase family protein [Ottowia flava]|uniref:CaiB/BaiF CoA transferase family protein n=1 Tax=Ottowia flava TaxID=2675430 RepID=A0ABW4KR39_9BURK
MSVNLSSLPLAGIKVLEIGQNIAGPYASEILSSLGADVVKIERPETGDDARGWGPPFWRGTATTFQAMNHGKRSVTADLKNPEHLARLKAYLGECDVLIQNMRPGSLEELGLGAKEVCAQHPKLIYCSLWAFGHTGPRHLSPGYEPMVQAFSGMFSVNGTQDGPSTRVGMQVLDLGTGIWAALGCLAALYRRKETGLGGTVDTSLFETALGWLQVMMAGYHATGRQPERHRSGNPNVVVFQALSTQDGEVVVAAANDRLFAKLARVVGRPDWVADERYASNASRVKHKAALLPELEAIFLTQPSQHWIEALEAVGIPCAPIQDFEQVLADPQTAAIDILHTLPEVDLKVVGLPVSFDGVRPPVKGRAPGLGEHNAELWNRETSS